MTAHITITDDRDQVQVELIDSDGVRQVGSIPNGGTRTIDAYAVGTAPSDTFSMDDIGIELSFSDSRPEKVT